MDKRISYKLVIDTETCPINKDVDGVFPSNMWAYDVGWAVVDKRGKVYRTHSFVNADTVCILRKENPSILGRYKKWQAHLDFFCKDQKDPVCRYQGIRHYRNLRTQYAF